MQSSYCPAISVLQMHFANKMVACCSTAMSVAVLFGGPLLPTLKQPSHVAAGFSWLASQLPIAGKNDVSCLNRDHSPSDPSTSLDSDLRISESIPTTISDTADVPLGLSGSTREERVSPTGKRSRSSPIDWLFDKPEPGSILASSGLGNGAVVTGLSIGGINTSDQPLTQVRGVLKPDKIPYHLELVLSLRGHQLSSGSGWTIPPGAQFDLVYEFRGTEIPMDHAAKFGGTVLTFRYTLAGHHRTSVIYLSESSIKEQLLGGGS